MGGVTQWFERVPFLYRPDTRIIRTAYHEGELRGTRSISVNNRFLLAAALFGLGLAGCSQTKPSLTDPGTAQQQQTRANRFDPYPTPSDNGFPSMAGTRPREYQAPAAEPMRADWNRWNPPCPAAGTAATQAPAAYPAAPYPPSGQPGSSAATPQAGPYATSGSLGSSQSTSPYAATSAPQTGRYAPAAYSGSSQPIPDSATQPAIPYSGATQMTPAGR
jgi:hypothetical protein